MAKEELRATDVLAHLRDRTMLWTKISPEDRAAIWELAVESGQDPTAGMLNMTNVFLERLTRKVDKLTQAIEQMLLDETQKLNDLADAVDRRTREGA